MHPIRRTVLVCSAILFASVPMPGMSGRGLAIPRVALSQQVESPAGTVAAGLLLRKLDGVKRVLMIGAHPDDEDTALLAALSRGAGAETAYLSLTRGEGGQNLIGPELGEGLGLLRTGELLSARRLDGGQQYFTRAFDFGFSKSAEETFRFWPREELLRDVTAVVRRFRPQVIISVFSGTPRDGHGQHQAAGLLAHEVFDVAGDGSRFPELSRQGLLPWTPSKLYRLTRRSPGEGTTVVETGSFDGLLGRSYFQLAMASRSQHRSQDMGMPQPMGPRESRLALVRSRVGESAADEIFTGVDTALTAGAEDLPGEVRDGVLAALEGYRAAVARAGDQLNALAPWKGTPPLLEAARLLSEAQALLSGPGGGGRLSTQRIGSSPVAALRATLREKEEILAAAILASAGVELSATVADDLLVPGEATTVSVELWNGGPFQFHVTDVGLEVPVGWEISPTGLIGSTVEVGPGELRRWDFQVTVSSSARPSEPYFLTQPRTGGMYQWPEDATTWGAPGDPDLIDAQAVLSIGGSVPVSARAAAHYRGVDKATGEFETPVFVVPPFSVQVDPAVVVWPQGQQSPRLFTATVRGYDETPRRGSVELLVPEAWEVTPTRKEFELAAGSELRVSFSVRAPAESPGGIHRVGARVVTPDGRTYSRSVALIEYPHVRRAVLLRDAEAKVSLFPLSLPGEMRVGYVMGSGDWGAEAIRQMGARVELLDRSALEQGSLGTYDAVVLGIRAYETRPDLALVNNRLLDYVRDGGTLIVQYNQYEFPRGGYAPFPVEMSRPHDRVTDETAPVRLLLPEHPALRWPNPIGPGDFEGWIQERGLYFLSRWDDRYTPLLEMSDPNEPPKRGGLLVAKVGRGVYVYTGLAFFRQFPAGVPGAYRLFANLLSLRGEDLQ